MDRDYFAELYEQHFLSGGSSFCRCGFNVTKTEPGDRDHARGWSTSATHMRKSYARHLADEYNRP
jgi:hypothetical protein